MNTKPDVADVITKAGHDAEQRRTITAVDDRESTRLDRLWNTAVQRIGHREQRGFVDQGGRRTAPGIRLGQFEVVVGDVVMVEGIGQACIV